MKRPRRKTKGPKYQYLKGEGVNEPFTLKIIVNVIYSFPIPRGVGGWCPAPEQFCFKGENNKAWTEQLN